MGEPDKQHLMPLKKNEELDRDEKLDFYSGNDATTLTRNLHKRCLTCKERETLQVCYLLWFMVTLYVLYHDNPYRQGFSYPTPMDAQSSSGNLHQYPVLTNQD